MRQFQQQRVLVENPLTYPYSAIGLLTFKHGSNTYMGTGFIISQYHVLTAAFHIYDKKKKALFKEFSFWPARNGLKGISFYPKKVFYPVQYETCQQQNYGLLQFEDPIGDIYGFFSLDYKVVQKQGRGAQLAGYPLYIYDKNGYRIKADLKMYTGQGLYEITQEGGLKYKICTSAGQAGSPLFIKQNLNYYAIGIHISRDSQFKLGTLLTNQRIQQIQKWIGGKLPIGNFNSKIYSAHSSVNNNKFTKLQKYNGILRELNLKSNQITQLPESIRNFVNLVQIDLSYNKIEKIPVEF